jgi:dihydrofolate reductase
MAELIYAISASLDGYIADENGRFDWSEPSDDAHSFFNDLQRSVGTVLNGRRMYETMRYFDTVDLEDLPDVQRQFAEAWRESEKVVFSSTMDTAVGPQARLERKFEPEAVRAMKEAAERDLSIAGPDLAGHAIRAGLVDRYLLRLIPVIVGGGTPALPDAVHVDLSLNDVHRFDDGSVMLDYRVH